MTSCLIVDDHWVVALTSTKVHNRSIPICLYLLNSEKHVCVHTLLICPKQGSLANHLEKKHYKVYLRLTCSYKFVAEYRWDIFPTGDVLASLIPSIWLNPLGYSVFRTSRPINKITVLLVKITYRSKNHHKTNIITGNSNFPIMLQGILSRRNVLSGGLCI